MAKNNLTPQQDIVTRQFFVLVAQQADAEERDLRLLRGLCLKLLNYDVVDGKFVETRTHARTHPYGTPPSAAEVGECQWVDDYKAALKKGGRDARLNNKDSFAPRTGIASKDSKIRKALLRKDV